MVTEFNFFHFLYRCFFYKYDSLHSLTAVPTWGRVLSGLKPHSHQLLHTQFLTCGWCGVCAPPSPNVRCLTHGIQVSGRRIAGTAHSTDQVVGGGGYQRWGDKNLVTTCTFQTRKCLSESPKQHFYHLCRAIRSVVHVDALPFISDSSLILCTAAHVMLSFLVSFFFGFFCSWFLSLSIFWHSILPRECY